MNLEVKVAADRQRVAGLAHLSHPLPRVDAVALPNQPWPGHVGVEVGALLGFAVDEEVVAVQDRVVSTAQHPAVADGHQRRATRGDDVEALVSATTAARDTKLADVAAGPVGTPDGKDVVVVGEPAVAGGDTGGGGRGEGCEKKER
jgi:hypothetical protein